MSDSVEILDVLPSDIPCNVDEMGSYAFLGENPTSFEVAVNASDVDVEFKASSLLIALDTADDITVNSDTCLVVNRTLQEVVADLIKNISEELKQIEISKHHISTTKLTNQKHDLLSTEERTTLSNGHDSSKNERFRYSQASKIGGPSFRCPYFQVGKYSLPPDNPETELRKLRGEFNLGEVTPMQWRKSLNDKLTHAVVEDLRQRLVSKYERDVCKAENELTDWLVSGPKESELKERIQRLKKKVAEIQLAPYDHFLDETKSNINVDDVDWMKLSATDFGGTVSERNLKLTWKHHFNKNLNYSTWSKSEDEALLRAVKDFGLHAWERVAQELKSGRTPFMCIQRYQQYLSPTIAVAGKECSLDEVDETDNSATNEMKYCQRNRQPWTEEEDKRLQEYVRMATDDQGVIHWFFVSAKLEGRSNESCRTRWKRINPHTKTGPFTENEDIQLLLAVQRFGVDNFDLVTSTALPDRDLKDCCTRYQQLLKALSRDWTYEEDRQLYLLTQELENYVRVKKLNSIPRRCFKELLVHFPGKSWGSIRNRYNLLMSWKLAYEKLRISVKTEDTSEEKISSQSGEPSSQSPSNEGSTKRWSKEEVRAVFMRTPFMLNLLEKLKAAGVKSGERLQHVFSSENVEEANEYSDDKGTADSIVPGSEISSMLKDASEGLVVPRPCSRVKWNTIVQHTEKKMMIRTRVHSYIKTLYRQLLKGDNSENIVEKVTKRRLEVIRLLLDDEDRFWLSLEQSLRHPSIAPIFQKIKFTREFVEFIPRITRRMINDTHQVLTNQEREAEAKNREEEEEIDSGKTKKIPPYAPSGHKNRRPPLNDIALTLKISRCAQIYYHHKKRENLLQLLEWKASPMDDLISQDGACDNLRRDSRRKINLLLSQALMFDVNVPNEVRCGHIWKQGISMNNLPPNKCTLGAFKTLLLHRGQLIRIGDKNMEALLKARRQDGGDKPPITSAETDDILRMRLLQRGVKKEVRVIEKHSSSAEIVAHQRILQDPQYLLLRARMYALFMWPALLSTGRVSEYLSEFEAYKEIGVGNRRNAEKPKVSDDPPVDPDTASSSKRKTPKPKPIYKTERMFYEDDIRVKRYNSVFAKKLVRRSKNLMNSNQGRVNATRRCKETRRSDIVSVMLSPGYHVTLPSAALDLIRNGFQIHSYYSTLDKEPCLPCELPNRELPSISQLKVEITD